MINAHAQTLIVSAPGSRRDGGTIQLEVVGQTQALPLSETAGQARVEPGSRISPQYCIHRSQISPARCVIGLIQRIQGERVADIEPAHGSTAQCAQVRAATERFADVLSQCADVGAFAAYDANV